jgi:hypothetical protein
MGNDFWPWENEQRMKEVMKYAAKKHMNVVASPAPYGYSNEALQANGNWAESQRVTGAEFQVDASGKRLNFRNSFPGLSNSGFEDGKKDWFSTDDPGIGINTVAHSGKASAVVVDAPGNARFRQKFPLKPWRQYHLRLFYRSSNFRGGPMVSVFDSGDFNKVRLNASINAGGNHDWTELNYAFNSQDSTEGSIYFGVWGGSTGILWFDDVQIEEIALVYMTRRPGTPIKVYDPANPSQVYNEGRDFNPIFDPRMATTRTPFSDNYHAPPVVMLPKSSHLKPGQTIAIDYFAAFPIPGNNSVAMCLTEPYTHKWLAQNARAIKSVLPSEGGLFLGYDEIRQMNSCGSCRAKRMSAGELLAWSVGQTISIYRSVAPGTPLYIWNDMFDPYHNANNHYFYVEGDLAGSWKGIPSDVVVMNWNLDNLKNSLTWFSGRDTRQPLPHRQMIAGYYDKGNGALTAQTELMQAAGVPGIQGLMYTTWNDDYSQLASYANAARAGWTGYLNSLGK